MKAPAQSKKAHGFSLVEIIVVLGIIIGLSTVVFGYIVQTQTSSELSRLYQDINFIRAAQSSQYSRVGSYASTNQTLGLNGRFDGMVTEGNPFSTKFTLTAATFTDSLAGARWALAVQVSSISDAEAVKNFFNSQQGVKNARRTSAADRGNLSLSLSGLTEITAPAAPGNFVVIYFE